ncbi:hypothetical protein [Aeromicrobium erythreum]|uniref:Yip1 domain-containing protein n=1 Tax=Aeromicrobium erythreum TaxID=2041 RepID=A0A0U4CKM1_9ACTN|nr:hypothetical protein [Aeromicrobium erythreum]ALX05893.1 hypothetical protein AERYTH_14885 [Aeromicrobium erythreum]
MTRRRRPALLVGAQVLAAYVLVACVALEAGTRRGGASLDAVPGEHPRGVVVSLGVLVLLSLPVVVLLALLLSAAMLQVALGLLDVELTLGRAVEVMLWAAVPLAIRNVLLGGVALAVGGEQAAALIRFGDPFVLAAAVVVVARLHALGVQTWRATAAALFVVGLPIVLQVVLGSSAA